MELTKEIIKRLQTEYLLQQGLDYSKDNVDMYGLDVGYLELVHETDEIYFILNRDCNVVNVLYKDPTKRLDSFEIN